MYQASLRVQIVFTQALNNVVYYIWEKCTFLYITLYTRKLPILQVVLISKQDVHDMTVLQSV